MDLLKKNGFITVLLLSSWPNAFFDMCGMASGYFMMPFWVFFSACLIGKGLIKVRSAYFDVLLSPYSFNCNAGEWARYSYGESLHF